MFYEKILLLRSFLIRNTKLCRQFGIFEHSPKNSSSLNIYLKTWKSVCQSNFCLLNFSHIFFNLGNFLRIFYLWNEFLFKKCFPSPQKVYFLKYRNSNKNKKFCVLLHRLIRRKIFAVWNYSHVYDHTSRLDPINRNEK
jgi:hypothetical protein